MVSDESSPPDGFEPGDRVRPLAGEFVGYTGTVVEVRSGIVIVEYEVFGRKVPAEHRPEDLNRPKD